MITVYTLPSNYSSRKSKAWFEERGINYTERRIDIDPLSKEELAEILRHSINGVDDILAKNSKEYKALMEDGVDFDDMTLSELTYAFKKHPTLCKAPIILHGSKLQIGFPSEGLTLFMTRFERRKWYQETLETIRKDEDERMANGEMVCLGHWG